jgi:plasmid stabilization system protein ParE
MSFSVVILPQAESDFQRNFAYIAERSQPGAQAWVNAFRDVLSALERQASICAFAPESQRLHEPVRHILFKTRHGRQYRVLFVIRDDRVYLLHIRGPGQNLMLPDEVQFPED